MRVVVLFIKLKPYRIVDPSDIKKEIVGGERKYNVM